MKIILTASLLLLTTHAQAGSSVWNTEENPRNLDRERQYHYLFAELPKTGKITNQNRGWADSYWPLKEGMIAKRYQVPGSFFDKNPLIPIHELYSISPEQMKLLSPAEKYDLALGKYDYPLTISLRKAFDGDEREWRGICNGWSQASLHFDEPGTFTYYGSPLKLAIPFGSADIKALLAYYYAKIDDSDTYFAGTRCRMPARLAFTSKACRDLNAGAFHVIMTNELGLLGRGFTADRDAYHQVWNQPFTAYEMLETRLTRERSRTEKMKDASPGTFQEYFIRANVHYAADEDAEENALTPSYEPLIKNGKNVISTVEYQYLVEVDYAGRVIGGEWVSDERPDFAWRQMFTAPRGAHTLIQKLYEQSLQ